MKFAGGQATCAKLRLQIELASPQYVKTAKTAITACKQNEAIVTKEKKKREDTNIKGKAQTGDHAKTRKRIRKDATEESVMVICRLDSETSQRYKVLEQGGSLRHTQDLT